MLALNVIDDIIISNCYPSLEELKSLENLDLNLVTFDVDPIENLPAMERKILFEELHFQRGDVNSYMIRSTPVSYTHLKIFQDIIFNDFF